MHEDGILGIDLTGPSIPHMLGWMGVVFTTAVVDGCPYMQIRAKRGLHA